MIEGRCWACLGGPVEFIGMSEKGKEVHLCAECVGSESEPPWVLRVAALLAGLAAAGLASEAARRAHAACVGAVQDLAHNLYLDDDGTYSGVCRAIAAANKARDRLWREVSA